MTDKENIKRLEERLEAAHRIISRVYNHLNMELREKEEACDMDFGQVQLLRRSASWLGWNPTY